MLRASYSTLSRCVRRTPSTTSLTVFRSFASKANTVSSPSPPPPTPSLLTQALPTAKKEDQPKEAYSVSFSRLLELSKPERHLIAASVSTLLVTSSITLSIPYIAGKIIDADPSTISPPLLAGGAFVTLMVAGGGVVTRQFLLTMAGERIISRLRKQLFSKTLAQDVSFFDQTKTADILTRLSSDCILIQSSLTTNFVSALRSTFMITGGITLLLSVSPKLAVISLCSLPPIVLGARHFGRSIRVLQTRVQEDLAATSVKAEEVISNMRTVKSFANEKMESAAYEIQMDKVYASAVLVGKKNAWFEGTTHMLTQAALLGVLGYGGSMVLAGEITSGGMASFMMYSMAVAGNVGGLSTVYAEGMKSLGATSRVFELIDKQPTMLANDTVLAIPAAAGLRNLPISFDNVSFAYPSRQDVKVLGPSMSLTVAPGEHVAICGSSGSGKSTMASLLCRMYDVNEGSVCLGDDMRNVKDYDPQELRKLIGVVSQEPTLFSSSIEDNIRYGRMDASDDEVKEAAIAANVYSFCLNFPDGLKTLVGEKGIQLSGGQKQRVALARVFLKGPPIVVLDEASSALDANSEFAVQEAVDRLMGDRTVISIAHRLSTIKRANRIVILGDGGVVEQGSFSELMKIEDGHFKKLVSRQLLS